MENRTADIIISFLDQYNNHFEKLADFLAVKQNRILLDDLVWLEEGLVEEQSYIMKGNSLESKRLALFEQCGLKDKKLSELPELFPEEYRGALRMQSERLSDAVAKIKRLNEVSTDIVQRKMKAQEKLLGVDYTGTGAYSGDARISNKGSNLGDGGDIIGSV